MAIEIKRLPAEVRNESPKRESRGTRPIVMQRFINPHVESLHAGPNRTTIDGSAAVIPQCMNIPNREIDQN